MKTFKVRTGLKAGQACGQDLLRQYCEQCGGAAPAPPPPPPAEGGGKKGGDAGWAKRGMDIGRQWSGGWF